LGTLMVSGPEREVTAPTCGGPGEKREKLTTSRRGTGVYGRGRDRIKKSISG